MELKLKHFILLCKRGYEPIGDAQYFNPQLIWDAVKKVLEADDYMPGTKSDVISILICNIIPCVDKNATSITMDILSGIDRHNCYKYGYFTNEHTEGNPKSTIDYDYQTAILYYLMSTVRFFTKEQFGELPNPDPNILPVSESFMKLFAKN